MTTEPSNKRDLLGLAKAEVSAMRRHGMAHPSTKPVLTGAAVGGMASLLLPVSLPIGVLAGAGIALYRRLK